MISAFHPVRLKVSYIFFLMLLGAAMPGLFAQTASVEVKTYALSDFTVCKPLLEASDPADQGFRVEVVNKTPDPVAFANAKLQPNTPPGMSYVAGSFTLKHNETNLPAAEPLHAYAPEFVLGSFVLGAGEKAVLHFKAKVNCRIFETIAQTVAAGTTQGKASNATRFTYANANNETITLTEPGGSESYNVLYADLETSLGDKQNNMAVARYSTVERTIKVKNAGIGALSEFRFRIKYENAGTVKLKGLKYNGIVLPIPAAPNANNEYIFVLNNNHFGAILNRNPFLDNNEEIVFTEQLEILGCNVLSFRTDFISEWGCEGSYCNTGDNDAVITSYITIPNGRARFDVKREIPVPVVFTPGTTATLKVTYRNLGSGSAPPLADRARNFQLYLRPRTWPADLTTLRIVANGREIPVSQMGDIMETKGNETIVHFDRLAPGVDVDGAGGLEDLDGDGKFDDLGVGSSMVVLVNVTAQCTPEYTNVATPNNAFIVDYFPNAYFDSDCYPRDDAQQWQPFNHIYTVAARNSITGPVDLVDGQKGTYTFYTERYPTYKDNYFSCPSNYFYFVLTVPQGYKVVKETAQWVHGYSYPIPAANITQEGQRVVVRGSVGSHYPAWDGSLKIDFVLDCAGVTTTTPTSTITYEKFYVCNDAAQCEQKVAQSSYEVYNHCNSCPGYHTTSFTAKRTTFGWPEKATGTYTWDELKNTPKITAAQAESMGLKLDAAYETDGFQAVATGQLVGDIAPYDNAHVKIQYTSPVNDALLDYKGATIKVNGIPCRLPADYLPVMTKSPAGHTYYFDFTVLPGYANLGSFTTGTTIDVYADFEVRKSNAFLYNGVYQLNTFRAYHYGIRPTNAEEGCESFGAFFYIYKPVARVQNKTEWQSRYLCDNYLYNAGLTIHPAVRSGTADDFPKEFRPHVQLNTMSVTVPADFRYAYEPGNYFLLSSPYNAYFYGDDRRNTTIGRVAMPDPVTTTEAGKKIMTWNNLTAVLPPLDVRMVGYGDGSYFPIFKFKPDLSKWQRNDAVNSVHVGYTLDVQYDQYMYSASPGYIESKTYSRDPQFLGHYFKNRTANLTLTADELQEGYAKQVKWPVTVCNPQTYMNMDATNTWVAVEPSQASTILKGATKADGTELPVQFYGPVDADHPRGQYMLVQMGTVWVSNCQRINVLAEYKDCKNDLTDELNVYYSWSCNAYPTPTAESVAKHANSLQDPIADAEHDIHTSKLFLRYKTANLQWTVNKLGEEQVDLCTEVPFAVDLTSSKYANMYQVAFAMELPVGVKLMPGSIYTYNGATKNLPEPVQQSLADGRVQLKWVVTDLTDFGTEKALPGSRVPGQNTIRLNYRLYADCRLDLGNSIHFFATGESNCKDIIALEAAKKLTIKGAPAIDDLDLTLNVGDYGGCSGGTNEVSLQIRNAGPNPTLAQILKIVLPKDIELLAEGVRPGAPSGNEVDSQKGIWVLTWEVPAGLASQSVTTYRFRTRVSQESLNGRQVTFDAATSLRTSALCRSEGVNCEVSATTGSATQALTIRFVRPVLALTALENLPVCLGSPVHLTAAFADANVAPAPYTYRWSHDPAVNIPNPTVTPAVTTTYTVTVTDANGCSSTASLRVPVNPVPTLSHKSLGVSCEGREDGAITVRAGSPTGSDLQVDVYSAGEQLVATHEVANGGSHTFEGLARQDYRVYVTDKGTNCRTGATVTVGYDGPAFIPCATTLDCGSTSGPVSFVFTVTRRNPGPSGAFTYSITDAAGKLLRDGSGQTTFRGIIGAPTSKAISGVVPGHYTVAVVDDNPANGDKGCQVTGTARVAALAFTATTDKSEYEFCYDEQSIDVPVTVSNNATACTDLSDVTYQYTLLRQDAAGAYQPVTGRSAGTTEKNYTFADLTEGKYRVSVALQGGSYGDCGTEASFSVHKPYSLFTVSVDKTNPTCYGAADGQATARALGGSGQFSYRWFPTGDPTTTLSVGATVTGLVAGVEYGLVVIDARGCKQPSPIPFRLSNPPQLQQPVFTDQANCSATASVLGGTPGYSFRWYRVRSTRPMMLVEGKVVESKDAQESLSLVFTDAGVAQGDATVSTAGLTPGVYQVEVTDAGGCTASVRGTLKQKELTRSYEICLGWKTQALPQEAKPEPVSGTTIAAAIAASDLSASLDRKVAECVAKGQQVLTDGLASQCLSEDFVNDQVSLDYSVRQQHFTLYYYERGNRLVRTVPPAGVRPLAQPSRLLTPSHKMVTFYAYNSLGQLLGQKTPDGGETAFRYNDLGQLRYSQNARQVSEGNVYSYTKYDRLGRVEEVGQAQEGTAFGELDPNEQALPAGSITSQQTKTVYSLPALGVSYQGQPQRYLQNRVSYSYTTNQNGERAYSYYSYDPHGNVEWVLQEVPGLGRHSVSYSYDLISGKVRQVAYNQGLKDQFLHRYSYDEDNRITSVETSRDGYGWEKDATYAYYLHGPLRRTELGEDQVQGLDYTYTIHGWLKGINSTNRGADQNPAFAPDAFGMGLGYYQGDYQGGAEVNTAIPGARSLYNGNISTWSTSTQTGSHNLPYEEQLTGQRFTYDRLNRLKSSAFSSFANGAWSEKAGEYGTTYRYDPNGNILSLTRNAYAVNGVVPSMDKLTYKYDESGQNNLLRYVTDAAGDGTNATDGTASLNGKLGDITDQQDENYKYDGTGNMTRDEAEKLTIHWNVYGKISQVVPDKDKAHARHIVFSYDATGNRVKKQVNSAPAFDAQGKLIEQVADPAKVVTTYYVRDGSGNVMSIYERTNEPAGSTPCDNPALCGEDLYAAVFRQVEVPLYGSDRVGQWSGGVEVARELFRKGDFSNVSFTVDPLMRKSDLNHPLAASQTQTVFGQEQDQVVAQESQLSVIDAQGGTLSPLVSFAGKLESNVTVAEDSKGEVKFFAATANYWGETVNLIYDKGGKLLKDSRSILTPVPSDEKAKSVAAVDMQDPTHYYLFTRGTDGKVYYQQVNTRAVGFGTQEEPMGEITGSGEISGSGYGRNMAVVEDKLHSRSLLYLTAYEQATGQSKLLRVTLEGGLISEPEVLTSYNSGDEQGQGQLQVSHQGRELVVYNHLSRQGWYDHQGAQLLRFTLDEDYKLLSSTAKTTLVTQGNLPKGSVQYSRDGKFLYYSQEALVLLEGTTTNKALVKQGLEGELATAGQTIATGSKGEIGMSGTTFLSLGEDANLGKLWQEHNLVSKLLADLSAPSGSTFASALSYAPHRVEEYNQVEGVLVRTVGQKDYELKDHLGNVRVVVSDRKEWSNNILSAAVRGYYHYYPFGMQMPQLFFPGNTADNGGYRYGYNGKEKDDEVKGGGAQYDYGFRIYDTRIAKFLSVDPLTNEYSALTPYQFASNSPVTGIDIDGLEFGWAQDLWNATTDGYTTTIKKMDEAAIAVVTFVKNSTFVVEPAAKVEVGITAKVNATFGPVKASAEVTPLKVKLYEAKYNVADPLNPNSFKQNYAGKDGKTQIINSGSLGVEVPIKGGPLKAGAVAKVEQSQYINGDLVSSGYTRTGEAYISLTPKQPDNLNKTKQQMESNGLSAPNNGMAPGKAPKLDTKTGKVKDFYGVDVGVGAALILSVDVNLKVGVYN